MNKSFIKYHAIQAIPAAAGAIVMTITLIFTYDILFSQTIGFPIQIFTLPIGVMGLTALLVDGLLYAFGINLFQPYRSELTWHENLNNLFKKS